MKQIGGELKSGLYKKKKEGFWVGEGSFFLREDYRFLVGHNRESFNGETISIKDYRKEIYIKRKKDWLEKEAKDQRERKAEDLVLLFDSCF